MNHELFRARNRSDHDLVNGIGSVLLDQAYESNLDLISKNKLKCHFNVPKFASAPSGTVDSAAVVSEPLLA